MLRLYDFWESGNCYKVRLLLAQLGVPFERVELDILAGETRTPLPRQESQRTRAAGRVAGRTPARRVERDPLLPRRGHAATSRRRLRARADAAVDVLRAVQPRAVRRRRPLLALRRARRAQSRRAPGQDGARLRGVGGDGAAPRRHPWFGGARYGVADIALYAYTHVADEGGFELGRFPAVEAWLARVRAEPGHVRITDEVGVPVPPPA